MEAHRCMACPDLPAARWQRRKAGVVPWPGGRRAVKEAVQARTRSSSSAPSTAMKVQSRYSWMVEARGCVAALVPGLGGRICPVSKALNRKGTSDLAYCAPPSTLRGREGVSGRSHPPGRTSCRACPREGLLRGQLAGALGSHAPVPTCCVVTCVRLGGDGPPLSGTSRCDARHTRQAVPGAGSPAFMQLRRCRAHLL